MKYTLHITAIASLITLSGCYSWPSKSSSSQCCTMNAEPQHELQDVQPVHFQDVPENTPTPETTAGSPPPSSIKFLAKNSPSKTPTPSKTLSDAKLEDILKEQDSLLDKLNNAETSVISINDERKLADIANRYENYLLNNSQDLYAHILYGKFLRKIDHIDRALEYFYKADDLNPNIPVVKQQIGNCLAELGEYALALPYLLEAIDLDPKVAQYHYQLGEFLAHYKPNFTQDGAFQTQELDAQMLSAFKASTQLEPENWGYKMRYAETYYALSSPNWNEALQLWNKLETQAPDQLSQQMVQLHQARILLNLNQPDQAQQTLSSVSSPSLQKTKNDLLKLIDNTSNNIS